MAISDAFNEELHDLADAGCPVIQMEEPQIHLLAARSYVDTVINPEFMLEGVQQHGEGAAGQDRGVVPHLLGQPVAAADVRQRCRRYKPALELLNQVDADVITFEMKSSNMMDLEDVGAGDHREEGGDRARSTITRCRWSRRRKWRTLMRQALKVHSGGAAGAVVGLRHGARGDEPAARVLQDGVAGAGDQHRAQGAGPAGGRVRSARIRSSR